MAKAVVHILETIQIQQEQGQHGLLWQWTTQTFCELFTQKSPIRQASQRIEMGQVAETLLALAESDLCILAGGDVTDETGKHALAINHHIAEIDFDRELVAIPMQPMGLDTSPIQFAFAGLEVTSHACGMGFAGPLF